VITERQAARIEAMEAARRSIVAGTRAGPG
jgi:hypothetical protein